MSDYGYSLRKLGQKVFPSMPGQALEICIIVQYVHGLGNFNLQKHVQFVPFTLDQAISAAVEYCALQGYLDKVYKPIDKEREINSNGSDNIVASLRPTNLKTECSLDDLQQMLSSLLDQKCEQKFSEKMSELRRNDSGMSNRSNQTGTQNGYNAQNQNYMHSNSSRSNRYNN